MSFLSKIKVYFSRDIMDFTKPDRPKKVKKSKDDLAWEYYNTPSNSLHEAHREALKDRATGVFIPPVYGYSYNTRPNWGITNNFMSTNVNVSMIGFYQRGNIISEEEARGINNNSLPLKDEDKKD